MRGLSGVHKLGRFLTQDPLGQEAGLNLYEYAKNNPLTHIDSDGLQVDTVADVIGIGLSLWDLVKAPSWSKAGTLLVDIGGAVVPGIPSPICLRRNAGWGLSQLCSNRHRPTAASQVGICLAKAWVLRVKQLRRSRKTPPSPLFTHTHRRLGRPPLPIPHERSDPPCTRLRAA